MTFSRETKQNVFARDKYKCVKCGESMYLSIDHIIPVSEGGTDEFKNLQTLCLACNHRKGSYLELTFLQRIKYIWNVDLRIQSLKTNIRKDFDEAIKKYLTQFVSHPLLHSAVDKNRALLEKQILELSNGLKGELGDYKKNTNVRLVGLENEITVFKKDVRDIERVLSDLVDFLEIEYTPRGFRNK